MAPHNTMDTGYFSESKTTSPGTTPSTTPGPVVGEIADAQLPPSTGNITLPALSREYPKPPTDIDVKAALERQPGRWTIKGQMEANQKRAQQSPEDDTTGKEKRAQEFEAAKKDLLASHQALRAPRS